MKLRNFHHSPTTQYLWSDGNGPRRLAVAAGSQLWLWESINELIFLMQASLWDLGTDLRYDVEL